MPLLLTLLNSLQKNIIGFLKDWYWDGNRLIFIKTLNLSESLDQTFALVINAKNLFRPLFQDYSIIGRLISFPARLLLLISGLTTYTVIAILSLIIALIWSAIPIILIINMFASTPSLWHLF